MDKPHLHHLWVRIRRPSLIFLTVGFVIFFVLSILALRQNNLNMLKLKQAVYLADEKNENLEQSLTSLRNYVYSHMNTNMRSATSSEAPIQLINQFNRYISAEQARLAVNGDSSRVYADAQASCERPDLTLTARAQCIQEYVVVHGGDFRELNVPPKELYAYDFASPRFTFDLAGVSIILSIILFILLIVRLIVGRIIKRYI